MHWNYRGDWRQPPALPSFNYSFGLVLSKSHDVRIYILGYVLQYSSVSYSYYLAISRESKRLDAVSRSPISPGSLNLWVVCQPNGHSLDDGQNLMLIDRNQIRYLPSISVNRWLAVRLEVVGAVIILIVSTLALVISMTSGVDAGPAGLF